MGRATPSHVLSTPARNYHPGMGEAVADRTINRKITRTFAEPELVRFSFPDNLALFRGTQVASYAENNGYILCTDEKPVFDDGDNETLSGYFWATGRKGVETWADVAKRVAAGNALLEPRPLFQAQARNAMERHLRQASLLMSGRHLQHGDETQPGRNMEVFTNCSTAANTFLLFYLLLNGSGVGRAYDDAMIKADLNQMPIVVCAIDWNHQDVNAGLIQGYTTVKDATHLYSGRKITAYEVTDSREGWAKAIEIVERMAFEQRREEVLILDFSIVRPRNAPIMGMQGRPASGPGPLMAAIANIAKLRDAGMTPWRAAIYADHYAAECVLVGGARRAARMATKTWRDLSVLDFIAVKRGGFLWSSNNSVTVDQDFRDGVLKTRSVMARFFGGSEGFQENWLRYLTADKYITELEAHAYRVMMALAEAAYHDGTGEPGIINQDRLTQNDEGLESYADGLFAEGAKFKIDAETVPLMQSLAKASMAQKYKVITNPCVTSDTWVQTTEGARQVIDLIDKPFKALVNGVAHQASGFWKTGDKKVFRVKTDRGYEIRATDNHKLLVEVERRRKFKTGFNVEQEWIEVGKLMLGDKLVLANHGCANGAFSERYKHGWLLGSMVGDGGYNPSKYPGYVRFWGENKEAMAAQAVDFMHSLPYDKIRPVALGEIGRVSEANKTITQASRALDVLADGLITEGSKDILPALEKQDEDFCKGFLSGLFDADGSVQGDNLKGRSVRLAQSNLPRLKVVQRMLARLGIMSTICEDRRPAGDRSLPDGHGGSADYACKANHELLIAKDNINRFRIAVNLLDPSKAAKLDAILFDSSRKPYVERFTAEVVSIEADGVEAVYDCTVDDVHRFDANGIIAHNCGEIVLLALGGYCVIADVVPFHAQNDDDAEDAFRTATRALIRTNLMDCLYKREVTRTNRIGVGITGFHEWAYDRFKFTWHDLVDEEKSKELWLTMSRFKRAIVAEAAAYSAELGVVTPHTNTTFKPSGSVSKLFGLTEGAHLPSMRQFIRWVQFRNDDPLVQDYEKMGYPIKHLKTYSGTTIVGFPTTPRICELDGGDWVVTAAEATPDEQYRYLRLLEKYWLTGVEEDGVTPLVESGNQISYTMKYSPSKVSFEQFLETLIEGQFSVRCCSVMPQTDTSAYEYTPEQMVSKDEYEHVAAAIAQSNLVEDVGAEHVDCGGGACPIDFSDVKAAA